LPLNDRSNSHKPQLIKEKKFSPRMTRISADEIKKRQEDFGQENRESACVCKPGYAGRKRLFLSNIFLSFHPYDPRHPRLRFFCFADIHSQ
jgi:hypothetical protein